MRPKIFSPSAPAAAGTQVQNSGEDCLFLSIIQKISVGLLVFGGVVSARATTPPPCAITAANLQIEVRSEPDDGAWGPTVEITVSDGLRPLSRLIAQEARPIEACWWADIDANQHTELVIGVGADNTRSGGVLIYEWDGQTLRPIALPALPATAKGAFRYVVSNARLWAYPVGGAGAGRTAAGPYRLETGRWAAVAASP
jgi:hypothetical protein